MNSKKNLKKKSIHSVFSRKPQASKEGSQSDQREIDKISKQDAELDEVISKLKIRIDLLEDIQSGLRERLSKNETTVGAMINDQRDKSDDNFENFENLNIKLGKFEDELSQIKKQFQSSIEELKEEVSRVEKTNDILSRMFDALEKRLAQVQKEQGALSRRIGLVEGLIEINHKNLSQKLESIQDTVLANHKALHKLLNQ